jgi:hypothetical protein
MYLSRPGFRWSYPTDTEFPLPKQHLVRQTETLYNPVMTFNPSIRAHPLTGCNMRRTAVLLGLLLLESCLTCAEASAFESVPFSTIEQGQHCGIHTNKDVVIRDQAEWTALWSEYESERFPKTAPPPVDFIKDMVVAVFLGGRRTGGFSVKIAGISAAESGLKVQVEETIPGRGCMVPMMITYPYYMVRLSRHDGTVVFDHSVRAENCAR